MPVSAVALGIAQGAVDACLMLAPAKRAPIGTGVLRDQPTFQARIGEAVALVGSSRAWLHAAIQRAWNTTLVGESVSLAERGELLLAAVNAIAPSRRGRPARVHAGRRQRQLSTQPLARVLVGSVVVTR